MRKQFNNVLVGGNGSGKTTFQVKVADFYVKQTGKRNLWLIPDDSEDKLKNIPEISLSEVQTFKGVAKMIIDNQKIFEDLSLLFLSEGFRFNGLMCCDDLSSILKRRPESVLRLFRRRRQANIDFLWSFHGWRTEVPPSFWTYVNNLYIFRTSDNHEETKKLLSYENQQKFESAYFHVQEKCKSQKYYFTELILNTFV